MSPAVLISIVIPSYNAAGTLKHVFSAIGNLASPGLLADIVIADSSDDNATRQVIDSCGLSSLKKIYFNSRRTPAMARNSGARIATGDVLAFLDADAYPEPHWLEEIAAAISRGYRVGGGSIDLPPDQRKNSLAIAQYYLQYSEYMPEAKSQQKMFAPSCNLFCERKLFYETGGFPEIRASEDVLFGLMVSKKASFWFVPEIKVFHIFNAKFKRLCLNQLLLGTYNILYRKQHYGGIYANRLIMLLLAPVFTVIKLFRISGRVCQRGSGRVLEFFMSAHFFILGLLFCGLGFAKGALMSWKDNEGKQ